MRYFIIAGEASGDIHAAQLIRRLKQCDSGAHVRFFGGDLMTQAAGARPDVHYRDMAYMGIVEVVKHLGAIMGFLDTAKRIIDSYRPDAIVLVDYPSFNLKVAKFARSRGIPVFYFISPKVWAWKEYRVKDIKRYVTELYSILPFETQFYASRHGYSVEYVGNPTVKEIAEARQSFVTAQEFRLRNGLPSQGTLVAVVPGSRLKEIGDNLPTMIAACERIGGLVVAIAAAPSVGSDVYRAVLERAGLGGGYPLLRGQTFELVAHSRAALVTSGTATLETAVIGTPQVVCYRMGGHRILYTVREHLIKTKYISLPNLIADDTVVAELILHKCSVDGVVAELEPLLGDTPERRKMLQGYSLIASRLGTADCAAVAASRITARLSGEAGLREPGIHQ